MSEQQGWFDNVGGGAPSAAFKSVGDMVEGKVVDQYEIDYVPFGKTDVAIDERTGQKIKQLVVVLQTEQKDWAGVSKIPTVSKTDKTEKPGSDDDGKRAIYIRRGTNIQNAIGRAVQATGEKNLANGGVLAVRLADTEDTGKGNPLKKYEAKYVKPVEAPASDGWVSGGDKATASDEPPF